MENDPCCSCGCRVKLLTFVVYLRSLKMGGSFSFSRGSGPPVEEVKQYCESIVFVKFYGQTSSMEGETDKTHGHSKKELGILLCQLDEVVRKAPSPAEFTVTDEFRDILKKISNVRLCVEDDESNECCYERLLKDSETFERLYRKRNKLSEVLSDENGHYWGTRQQMMFGKVISDWIEGLKKGHGNRAMDPVFGLLLNPTGGRVGPGDTNWFHHSLFDDYGSFAYHSAVHDGFGYLKTNHNTGPGYNYLDKGLFGDSSPMGGQLSGISFWKSCLDKHQPETSPDKFYAC